MTGTWINCAAVLAGGGLGLLLRRGLSERLQTAVTQMLGLATVVIALNGLLSTMLSADPETGKISSSGEMLLLVSLVLGALFGTLLDIDGALERLGRAIEGRLHADHFARGFVGASLLFCVGAMAIVGPLNDGLSGDISILLVKSALDFVSSIVLASTLGAGVLFAAATVLVFQGALTLLAGALSQVLVGALLNNMIMVGYSIVVCVGVNFFGVLKIKTANLLPALLVPVLYQVAAPCVYNLLKLLKSLW